MDYLKINILVVEDNLQDYIIFKEILGQIRDFFIHIEHAQSMAEAVELVKTSQFDIVFLDLFLPDSFGQETFTRLEPHVGTAPVVVLSGLSDKNIALEIVKHGAQDYIVKGEFDATLLEKSIVYSIERKKYQDRLQQSEQKYRSTFQSVGVAIGEYDYTKLKKYVDELKQQGVEDFRSHINLSLDNLKEIRSLLTITNVNPATLRLYDCESIEEFQENAAKFYVPETIVHLEALIEAVWNGEENYQGEAPFITLKGREIRTWKQAKFLGNELGYYRMLMSTSDVTKLSEKEDEVKVQSKILKGISDSAGELLSEDSLPVILAKALEIIGLSLVGDRVSLYTYSYPESGPEYSLEYRWNHPQMPDDGGHATEGGSIKDLGLEKHFNELKEGNCAQFVIDDLNIQGKATFDRLGVNMVVAAPIFDQGIMIGSINIKKSEQGEQWSKFQMESLLTLARNIGSTLTRHNAQKALFKMNENLEHLVTKRTGKMRSAIKELESFSYSVSHDLRAPLRAISGFSQVLADEYSDAITEEGRSYLDHILKGASEMSQLIDDLLDFSRMGRRRLEFSALGIEEMVNEVIRELSTQVPDRNINFMVHNLHDCQGDRSMIKQVLVNFVWNAIKYTSKEETAHITVGCEDKGDFVEYYITDNGVGFDMAYVDKLFGVFQRLHPEEEFDGTGVGLAIVQRIVGRHTGQVRAEGVVDEGATFYFTLPKIETEMEVEEEISSSEL
jgi:signal transduction histidine kinase/CheY-like chemotaxis protein